MLTTLTIIILGLAAYIGVLLNQKRELRSELAVKQGKLDHWLTELFMHRAFLNKNGFYTPDFNDEHPFRDAEDLLIPQIVQKHIVPLPAKPLYLCQRPTTSKCKDRVKQGEEAPLVVLSHESDTKLMPLEPNETT